LKRLDSPQLTESIPEVGESVGGYSVTILGRNISEPFGKSVINCKFGNILCKKVISLIYSFKSLVNGFLLLKLSVKFSHIHQGKLLYLYLTMDLIGTLSTKNLHSQHVLLVKLQAIITPHASFVLQEHTSQLPDYLIVLNVKQTPTPPFQDLLVVIAAKPTQRQMESLEQLLSLNVFAKKNTSKIQ
jgi:hypothetical protein